MQLRIVCYFLGRSRSLFAKPRGAPQRTLGEQSIAERLHATLGSRILKAIRTTMAPVQKTRMAMLRETLTWRLLGRPPGDGSVDYGRT
jgi:hypothetical protein